MKLHGLALTLLSVLLISTSSRAPLFNLEKLPVTFYIFGGRDFQRPRAKAIVVVIEKAKKKQIEVTFYGSFTGIKMKEGFSIEVSSLERLESQLNSQQFGSGLYPLDTILGMAILVFSKVKFSPPGIAKSIIISANGKLSLIFENKEDIGGNTMLTLARCPKNYCRVRVSMMHTVASLTKCYEIDRPCLSKYELKTMSDKLKSLGYSMIQVDQNHNCYFEALVMNSNKKMSQKDLREKLWQLMKALRGAIEDNPELSEELTTILGLEQHGNIAQYLDYFFSNEGFIEGDSPLHWGDVAFTPFMVHILDQPINILVMNQTTGGFQTHPFGALAWESFPALQHFIQQQEIPFQTGALSPGAPIAIVHDGLNHFNALVPCDQ
ncbi:MAG: hypothetical protein ACR2PT_13740 [Endozoicomonas sp.]